MTHEPTSGGVLPGLSGLLDQLGGDPEHRYTCSRARCTAEASWAIVWRNPKIHAADHRKTWLACETHRDELRDFLAARDFPLEVRSVSELEEQDQK